MARVSGVIRAKDAGLIGDQGLFDANCVDEPPSVAIAGGKVRSGREAVRVINANNANLIGQHDLYEVDRIAGSIGSSVSAGVAVRPCAFLWGGGCFRRWGDHVTSSPLAAKLVGSVKPWATRLRTWRRLLVPSMRPLDGLPVRCQARISVDQLMMVSTMLRNSGSSPVA